MATHGFLLLLLVANSKAVWDSNFGIRSWSPGRARAFECTGTGLFCDSCSSTAFCTEAGATPQFFPCETGQICAGTSPAIACTDYTGAGADGNDCKCGTSSTIEFLVDTYETSKYVVCLPDGQQYFFSCADGETFSTDVNSCVEATTTTLLPTSTTLSSTTISSTTTAAGGPPDCTTTGYHEYAGDCKQFYACQSDDNGGYEVILYRCPGSLVYIPSTGYCNLQSELDTAPGCITS